MLCKYRFSVIFEQKNSNQFVITFLKNIAQQHFARLRPTFALQKAVVARYFCKDSRA